MIPTDPVQRATVLYPVVASHVIHSVLDDFSRALIGRVFTVSYQQQVDIAVVVAGLEEHERDSWENLSARFRALLISLQGEKGGA